MRCFISREREHARCCLKPRSCSRRLQPLSSRTLLLSLHSHNTIQRHKTCHDDQCCEATLAVSVLNCVLAEQDVCFVGMMVLMTFAYVMFVMIYVCQNDHHNNNLTMYVFIYFRLCDGYLLH